MWLSARWRLISRCPRPKTRKFWSQKILFYPRTQRGWDALFDSFFFFFDFMWQFRKRSDPTPVDGKGIRKFPVYIPTVGHFPPYFVWGRHLKKKTVISMWQCWKFNSFENFLLLQQRLRIPKLRKLKTELAKSTLLAAEVSTFVRPNSNW